MMHIQKICLLAAMVFVFTGSFAQKNRSASSNREDVGGDALVQMYKNMYQTSLEYNDLAIATQATYALLALEPENTKRLDTLAQIYFQRSAFAQAILVSSDVLKKEPTNQGMLELRAFAKQSLGAAKEALEDYEFLHSLSNDPYHLYEIATLQYSMRRFGECENSITKLLASPDIKDKTISLSYNKIQQAVPFNAALHNLYGVVLLDQGKSDDAKKHFDEALEIAPEFYLAKANIESMESK